MFNPKLKVDIRLIFCMSVAIALWLLQCRAYGSTTPYETRLGDGIVIGEAIEYLEIAAEPLSLNSILSEDLNWQKNSSEIFNRGYSKSTWWLRFNVHNSYPEERWLLEIAYPVLDKVNIYLVYPDGERATLEVGDKLPFAARPIPHRFFLIPFELSQSESVTIYLEVKSTSAIQLPLMIWDRQTFYDADLNRNLIEGFYFGGIAIIGLYNFLLFMVLGGRVYLYYLANAFSILLFVACLHGWGYQFLWPNANHWNDTSILFSLSLVLVSAWAFSAEFLETLKISRLFVVVHISCLSFAFMLVLLTLLIPYRLAIATIIPFALLSCVWGFVSGIAAWRNGNSSARYYLIAWSMFLAGGIVIALNKYDFIPRNLMTDSAVQLGSLLDVLLFSLALAARINKERTLRFEAQRNALFAQQEANEKLEMRVAERTNELHQANQMLQEMSDTDQLTGLKNRRYLEKVLDTEFTRPLRYRRFLAVLLIDVDHFKRINDNHGHLVGDACLRTIARRISQTLRRSSDLACRYGGEEFCVVLPEADEEKAMHVAETLRKNVQDEPIQDGDFSVDVTISIGIYTAIPSLDDSPLGFFANADKALYTAKTQGRNRIVVTDRE